MFLSLPVSTLLAMFFFLTVLFSPLHYCISSKRRRPFSPRRGSNVKATLEEYQNNINFNRKNISKDFSTLNK
jgi:hypothetical protein